MPCRPASSGRRAGPLDSARDRPRLPPLARPGSPGRRPGRGLHDLGRRRPRLPRRGRRGDRRQRRSRPALGRRGHGRAGRPASPTPTAAPSRASRSRPTRPSSAPHLPLDDPAIYPVVRRLGGDRDGAQAGPGLPPRARRARPAGSCSPVGELPRQHARARSTCRVASRSAARTRAGWAGSGTSQRRLSVPRRRARARTRSATPTSSPRSSSGRSRPPGPGPWPRSSPSRSSAPRSPRSCPPDGYWPAIAEVCRRHGVLLVADEVMTGFGRTGRWFGLDHWGVRPDILVAAKGATSGYWPFGFVAASGAVHDAVTAPAAGFVHGFTYSHHVVGAAVAARGPPDPRGRVARRGERGEGRPAPRPARRAARRPSRTSARSAAAGCWSGSSSSPTARPAQPFPRADRLTEAIVRAARADGLLLYSGTGLANGVDGDSILLGPPFVVTDDELERIADGLAGARSTRRRARPAGRLPSRPRRGGGPPGCGSDQRRRRIRTSGPSRIDRAGSAARGDGHSRPAISEPPARARIAPTTSCQPQVRRPAQRMTADAEQPDAEQERAVAAAGGERAEVDEQPGQAVGGDQEARVEPPAAPGRPRREERDRRGPWSAPSRGCGRPGRPCRGAGSRRRRRGTRRSRAGPGGRPRRPRSRSASRTGTSPGRTTGRSPGPRRGGPAAARPAVARRSSGHALEGRPGSRRRRLTGLVLDVVEAEPVGEPLERTRGPPVPVAEQAHRGRHEQDPDDRRVEQRRRWPCRRRCS